MVRNKHNTPVIIKYPFWQMTYQNPKAVYACVNLSRAYCPPEIRRQTVCIEGDIGEVLELCAPRRHPASGRRLSA